MINEKQARALYEKLIAAKKENEIQKSKESKKNLSNIQRECIENFSYMVEMRTAKYKNYPNYDDLNQEGYLALLKSFDSYNPELGSLFSWIHFYVKTKISRAASLHTVIKYPLKYAKTNIPRRESFIPEKIEKDKVPDKLLEAEEIRVEIENKLIKLSDKQRQVIINYFGLKDNDYLTINKICKALNMTRLTCIRDLQRGIYNIGKSLDL